MSKYIYIFAVGGVAIILIISLLFHKNSSYKSSASDIKRNAEQNLPANITIAMDENGFLPSEVTIKKGETVQWINNGKEPHWPASNLHPTHGIYPEFDPLVGIEPGKSWSFTFTKTGSWRFHDHLKPLNRGVINVKE